MLCMSSIATGNMYSSGPPGTPRDVSISNVGSTWVKLKWSMPLVYSSITHYEITYADHNGNGKTITENRNLTVHITDLTPESTYEFVVVAVSSAGGVVGKSQPSNPVQCHTTVLSKQLLRHFKNLFV